MRVGRRRRLVIVPQDVPVAHPPSSSSRDAAADAPISHVPEVIPMSDGSDQESDGAVPDPVADDSDNGDGDHRMTRAIQEALQSLDFVNVQSVFRDRACLMRSPPVFLRRMYKSALRVALTEFHQAGRDDRRRCRAWKLLLLLPRLLLFRLARGGLLPKRQLQVRFDQFMRGQWTQLLILLISSRDCCDRACQSQHRRRRTQTDTIDRRAERAEALVHLGELSSGRHALEGAPLAPGNEETRRALTDERLRPPMLRAPLSEDLLSFQPESSLHLSQALLLKNLKCARRGAAGGPSGMTAEHLRPVLESSRDAERFWNMCQSFRMGRITALQKPTGGVRGIVAGDIIRRLVARTIAQQFGTSNRTFQYALTTRAGCECIGHILQSETDDSPNRTVLSIDGIGAFTLCPVSP